MESNRVLILTGAGFTANFGGYLGEAMYDAFYNRLNCESVKELVMQWESEDDY